MRVVPDYLDIGSRSVSHTPAILEIVHDDWGPDSAWNCADWNRWAKYGLTPEAYQEMLEEQGGLCSICRQSSNERSLAVDHDHISGRVRRLLCTQCNIGIGLFRESPAFLRQAAEYIEYYDSL